MGRNLITAVFMGSLFSGQAFGYVLPLCERTPAVTEFIVKTINQEQRTTKTCAEITQQDLDTITRVSVAGKNIHNLKSGDFTGLYNLEILNIRSNPYKTLPLGLFSDLQNLKTIVIIGTGLEEYPTDFLQDTPNLENLHSFRNRAVSLPDEVLERFENILTFKAIDLDLALEQSVRDRLRTIFPTTGTVQLAFF